MTDEKQYLVYWIGKGMEAKKRDNEFLFPVSEDVALEHCSRLNSVYKDMFWLYEENKIMTKIIVVLGRRTSDIFHLELDDITDAVEIYNKASEATQNIEAVMQILEKINDGDFEYE